MVGSFNVSGIVRLVDDFTSKARTIAASTDLMTSRFDKLKAKAAGVSNTLRAMVATAIAAFSIGAIKRFLQEAANESVLVNRFEQMFSSVGSSIKIGRAELEKEIQSLGLLGRFDEDDIKGNVAAPMMRSGKIAGQNFLRAMQLAVNMGALEGNTPEALARAGSEISAILSNPRLGLRKLARMMPAKEIDKLKQMIKLDKNLAAVQGIILAAYEKRYTGAAKLMETSPAGTLAQINLGLGEFESGIGNLINSGFGEWFRALGKELQAIGNSFSDVAGQLNELSSGGEKLKKLLEIFNEGSIKTKALAVGVVGLATVITLSLGAAILGILGPIGSALAIIASLTAGAFAFKKELTSIWDSSLLAKAGILAVVGAIAASLVPAMTKLALMVKPFMLWVGGLVAVATLAASFGLLGPRAKAFVDEIQKSSPIMEKLVNIMKAIGVALTLIAAKAVIAASATALMALGPLLIPALIGAALVGIPVFAEEIKAAFTQLFEYLGRKISETWTAFKDSSVVAWFGELGTKISEIWTSFKDSSVVTWVIELGKKIPESWAAFKDSSVLAWVKDLGKMLWDALTAPFEKVKELLSGLKLGDTLSSIGNSTLSFLGLVDAPKLPAVSGPSVPLGAKATSEAKVSGEVTINVKDPAGRSDVSIVSKGDVPLNKGQTSGGSYRSTTPSQFGKALL